MREMNAQEVVRWLNELEARCNRLRWIAATAVLVAVAALVIPALPKRVSPWSREYLQAFELRSPDRLHTGRFVFGVAEGHDPYAVLTSTNREAHASLEIDRGTPTLNLFDETGSRLVLRLAPDGVWDLAGEAKAPRPGDGFYGLSMREPADSGESRVRLGGDRELLALDLASPTHGSLRLRAGRKEVVDPTGRDEEWQSEGREPGTALVMFDAEGKRRVSLSMVRQSPPAEGSPETVIPAEGPIPELTLHDETGKARAVLRLDPVLRRREADGSVRMDDPLFAPSLVLRDHRGQPRIEMRLDADGSPRIRLKDVAGRIIWSAP